MFNKKNYTVEVDGDFINHEAVVTVTDNDTKNSSKTNISFHKYDEDNHGQLALAIKECFTALSNIKEVTVNAG